MAVNPFRGCADFDAALSGYAGFDAAIAGDTDRQRSHDYPQLAVAVNIFGDVATIYCPVSADSAYLYFREHDREVP